MMNVKRSMYLSVFTPELLLTMPGSQRLLSHLRKLAPKKTGGGPPARILVFVLYKKEASRVENTLRRAGFAANALHGDMAQAARLEALQQFRDGATRLLVATDVAARGLDIPDVGCVLNYSFPLTIEDYIHRIGRTGEQAFFTFPSIFLRLIDDGMCALWDRAGWQRRSEHHILHWEQSRAQSRGRTDAGAAGERG